MENPLAGQEKINPGAIEQIKNPWAEGVVPTGGDWFEDVCPDARDAGFGTGEGLQPHDYLSANPSGNPEFAEALSNA